MTFVFSQSMMWFSRLQWSVIADFKFSCSACSFIARVCLFSVSFSHSFWCSCLFIICLLGFSEVSVSRSSLFPEDVILTCQGPSNDTIHIKVWTRPDLQKSQYVFMLRDGHIDKTQQHPSFKNRVELRDGNMKNGDLSVILRNVTEDDSGTYECRFIAGQGTHRKRGVLQVNPSSIITLKVADPDANDGPAGHGLTAVAVVAALALIGVVSCVVFVIYRK
ncbi:uncharacterized protein LOC115376710 isoform X2 [Myripristis murdjan]|uniref:uncharacterized protein LOC115376710 isoform X2 n=1 Tax=Myripristis murdjan TaxID=586833 RepID=UPI001175D10F|nr:uncharacterized protein LOC115376710 isoform X2 [Myripristis murdjan]